MVCAESLACGTPVVGFRAGAPEQISLSEFSEFVDYGNLDQLEDCVLRWLEKKASFHPRLVAEADAAYSVEKMCEGYMDIYELFKEN